MFRNDAPFRPRPGDAELEQRVRRDLAFLFDEHGATVSDSTVGAFGISQVRISVGNLEFEFERNDRDQDFLAVVGPRNGLGVWELLHVALAASTGEDVATLTVPISYSDDPATLSYIGLTKLAAVLKPRFEHLNQAFAPENYPATHSKMIETERIVHPK